MALRALLLALSCASIAALTPFSAAGDDNDCALYLSGPGRTSAYDYSLNLLRGNNGYEGQHTCITYDAVNQAYIDARKRILVAQPKGDWKAEDFASVGELILDISINLARTYGLTYEEIEKGLPLIDTSRTLIREVCPPVFSHVECRAGKYRRMDGLCNNLQHPTWGSTMAPFQRLIGPLFADGINSPRIAHSGRDLPLSRVVSRTMHPDEGFHDHAGTVMVIAWGQFMDHDYTLTGTPLDPRNRNDPEECCKRPQHLKHPYCNEIRIPDDDYFYRLFGVNCIDFVRGFPSPRPGCRLGSRVPFNTLTGVIDGNTVYGVTEKFARKLRTGYGGLLRMNSVFKEYGLKDLLPLKLDIPEEGCTRPNKNMYCFEAGEIRVNEQLVLTVMHTLMAREHNRVAKGLAEVNPHWDDETLYQEARRINIAEIQHITYNEFLPILLGKDVMDKFGLVLEKEGYWDGFDSNVNPDVIDAFAAAAYRFGHSLLPTAVERWSKAHKFIASKRLSDLIRRPYDLYRAGVLDEYVMGLMNQVAQAMDDSITQEVTNHLFKKVGARFGMDLVSFNMQRGREFGLPGYMEFRKFCGLSGAETFQELFGAMPNETVRKYESIFEHPVDVDLWSGGVSERPLPGSMLGPTFACVIATQFSYSRRGDRFWYELPNQPSSFTPEQLKEVRKARLARVICDNTDIIDTVQLYPMVLPDHELNPRVPCRSGIIPSIDFSKWAEPPPFAGNAKQFITDAVLGVKNISDVCTEDIPSEASENTITDQGQNNTDNIRDNTLNLKQDIKGDLTNKTDDSPSKERKDSILKYVYKNNVNTIHKPSGHPKNSLKRRKRSSDNPKTPLVIDYSTLHEADNTREPLIPLQRNSGKYIKGSDLADFNIETLHDGLAKSKHNSEIQKHIEDLDYKEKPKLVSLPSVSSESTENEENRSTESSYRNKNENEDHDETPLKSHRNSNEDSKEKKEESNSTNQNYNSESQESNEKDYDLKRKFKTEEKVSGESEESNENRYVEPNSRTSSYRSYKPNPELNKQQLVNQDNSEEDNKSSDGSGEITEHSNEKNNYKQNKNIPYIKPNSRKFYANRKSPYRSDRPKSELNKKQIGNQDSSEEENKGSNDSAELIDNSNEKDSYKQKNINQYVEPNSRNVDVNRKSPYKSDRLKSEFNKQQIGNQDSSEEENKGFDDSAELVENSNEKNSFKQKNINQHVEPTSRKFDVNRKSPYRSDRPKSEFNKQQLGDEESSEEINKGFDASAEVIENSSEKNSYKEKIAPLSSEENYDNSQNQVNEYKKPYIKNEDAPSSESIPIQDVDLKDFSHESIKINSKGEVEPVRENENYEQGSDEESAIQTTTQSNLYDKSDYNKHPKLNRGEIKPVIEISNESGSRESDEDSDENVPGLNSDLNNRDENLKTILDFSSNHNNAANAGQIRNKVNEPNENVKQEFERIPLDYNHDKTNIAQPDIENHEAPVVTKPLAQEVIKTNIDTQEILQPTPQKDIKYDEKLNIKFDDIAITLPEIKLPKDILAYNYDEEPKQKDNFYRYSHEVDKDPDDNIEKDDISRDSDYYGHNYSNLNKNKKQKDNYKNKQKLKEKYGSQENTDDYDEDEDEDLYEKFVRERFGKRSSFEKRSEKLLQKPYLPMNGNLYKTIGKILKQTEETSKQAEKSGDPNAGYMWTLEYGEKL